MRGGEIGMVSHVEILVMLIAVGHVASDESYVSSGQLPVVFPAQLPQASAAVSGLISNAFGWSDVDLFMSDIYWPVPLNNSSILNLTA